MAADVMARIKQEGALMMEAVSTIENAGQLLRDYTAQHPRRLSSAYWPP
jgi:hypothetical protein